MSLPTKYTNPCLSNVLFNQLCALLVPLLVDEEIIDVILKIYSDRTTSEELCCAVWLWANHSASELSISHLPYRGYQFPGLWQYGWGDGCEKTLHSIHRI